MRGPYQEFAPPKALSPYVECGWMLAMSSDGRPSRVLPDGCLDLHLTPDGALSVAGPATTFYDVSSGPERTLVGLRFRPAAAVALTREPANELRDGRISIELLWGAAGRELTERLLAGGTPYERLAVLEDVLLARLASRGASHLDQVVVGAVELLRARPDRPVGELAAVFGLGERQLRRRFDAATGYGPKRLGRILRFQRLLDLVRAHRGKEGWADVALQAGYCDQSHMIAETRVLAGVHPTSLMGAGGIAGAAGSATSVSSNTSADTLS